MKNPNMPVHTRLRKIRTARRISAADLARRIGVSRQTIYAIEDGTFVPNTMVALRLSRALDVTVEEIFSIPSEQPSSTVQAELLASNQGGAGRPVRVCRVNDRLLAVPTSVVPAYLPTADGIIESRKKSTVAINSAAPCPDDGKRLLLAGCDPALSVLQDALATSGIEIITVPCSSQRALAWLRNGKVHAAGSHLLDRATGTYNVPIVRRLFASASVRTVTFAFWEQGLVIPHGNPKSIRSIADLARKDVVLINREKGSGSRDLLDNGLRQAGIPSEKVRGYHSIAEGHLAAAYAVAAGTADCCIAPRSASRCFGLDFLPSALERFDLSFARAFLELPAAKALLDVLSRSDLKKKLQCVAGYETSHTGEVLI